MDILYDFFFDKIFFGAIGMHNLMGKLSDEAYTIPVAGYHVLLTTPYFCNCQNTEYKMREFELLTAELSARLWRRYNGPIYMLTDAIGERYANQSGLAEVYDDVFPVLEQRNYGINFRKYWASGKIQALMRIKSPCAIIDLDLLVWHPLELNKYIFAAAHTEPLRSDIYPPSDFFRVDKDYFFPRGWDWTVEPLNTSIMYFSDESFKDYYAKESIRFMQSEKETPDDGSTCMVFAEQRILAMCVAQKGIPVHTLFEHKDLCSGQDWVTHIWSAKGLFRKNQQLENTYNALCRKKILQVKSMGIAAQN